METNKEIMAKKQKLLQQIKKYLIDKQDKLKKYYGIHGAYITTHKTDGVGVGLVINAWDGALYSKNTKPNFLEDDKYLLNTFICNGTNIDDIRDEDCYKFIDFLMQTNTILRYKKWKKVFEIMYKYGDFGWCQDISFELIDGGIKIIGPNLNNEIIDMCLGNHKVLFDNNILKYNNLKELEVMLEFTKEYK